MLPLVFERFAYLVSFLVFELFALQTVSIKKNLIQYSYVFEWFAV